MNKLQCAARPQGIGAEAGSAGREERGSRTAGDLRADVTAGVPGARDLSCRASQRRAATEFGAVMTCQTHDGGGPVRRLALPGAVAHAPVRWRLCPLSFLLINS